MKTAYDIIIKPVITEQSMEATEDKKYVFQVAIDANKVEIKKAVEEIFGVKVEKVNTIRMEGTAFAAQKANGRHWDCGFANGHLYAGFPHLYWAGTPLPQRFVTAAAQYAQTKTGRTV